MTDLDRLRDAVVQALKGVRQAPLPPGKHTTSGGVVFVPLVEWANVENALAALDAYPTRAPAPAPERTVTLAAMEDVADGEVCLVNPSGTRLGVMVRSGNWRCLGTVTLPLAEGGA